MYISKARSSRRGERASQSRCSSDFRASAAYFNVRKRSRPKYLGYEEDDFVVNDDEGYLVEEEQQSQQHVVQLQQQVGRRSSRRRASRSCYRDDDFISSDFIVDDDDDELKHLYDQSFSTSFTPRPRRSSRNSQIEKVCTTV